MQISIKNTYNKIHRIFDNKDKVITIFFAGVIISMICLNIATNYDLCNYRSRKDYAEMISYFRNKLTPGTVVSTHFYDFNAIDEYKLYIGYSRNDVQFVRFYSNLTSQKLTNKYGDIALPAFLDLKNCNKNRTINYPKQRFANDAHIATRDIYDLNALSSILKNKTNTITVKLLKNKLSDEVYDEIINAKDANNLSADYIKNVRNAFNSIIDNIEFYMENASQILPEKGSEAQIRFDSLVLNGVFYKDNSEIWMVNDDLTDSEEESIRWFNIFLLKQIFPGVLTKTDKGYFKSGIYEKFTLASVPTQKALRRIDGKIGDLLGNSTLKNKRQLYYALPKETEQLCNYGNVTVMPSDFSKYKGLFINNWELSKDSSSIRPKDINIPSNILICNPGYNKGENVRVKIKMALNPRKDAKYPFKDVELVFYLNNIVVKQEKVNSGDITDITLTIPLKILTGRYNFLAIVPFYNSLNNLFYFTQHEPFAMCRFEIATQ